MEAQPGTSKTFGKKGQVLHSQAREIISCVIDFMTAEAQQGITIPLQKIQERVAAATNISQRELSRIVKEKKQIAARERPSFSTPHKERPRRCSKTDIPEGEKESIRSMIHDFYIIEKRRPTLSVIMQKIRESEFSFEGGISALRKIILNLGFRWKKTADNRQFLMETHDIQHKRIVYLKQLAKYKQEGRPIVYMDETYINSGHTTPNEWIDTTNVQKGPKTPIGKGRRLIIVHAGGAMGFIPNALLIFTSGCKSGDYHDEMNHENFMKWTKEQLLPNLPQNCVVVIDNASYHNVSVEPQPTSSWRKADMVTWLVERGITPDLTLTKPEIYQLIKENKPQAVRYKLDVLMNQYGHNVLRLPPYHPELNPIEKIWANVKNWVAIHNLTFKLADVNKLAIKRFSEIGQEEWVPVCNHADKVAENFMHRLGLLDAAIEEALCFTVNTGESDTDSDLSGVEPLSDEEQ